MSVCGRTTFVAENGWSEIPAIYAMHSANIHNIKRLGPAFLFTGREDNQLLPCNDNQNTGDPRRISRQPSRTLFWAHISAGLLAIAFWMGVGTWLASKVFSTFR